MNALSEIKRHIMSIAGRGTDLVFVAKVVSVEGETCTVSVDGLQLTDVRLRAVVNGKTSKILVTPEVDSYVLVSDISCGKMTAFRVSAVSEVSKIEAVCEDVVINCGTNGGMVKINELTEKLNQLKDTVNALARSYNAHTHQVATTGTATAQTGTAAAIMQTVSEAVAFAKSDYEDEKFKH